MPAATFCPNVLSYPRYLLALATVCCGGFVEAQEEAETAPQLELATLSTPSMQHFGSHMDSRFTLTGWSGPAPTAGLGVGVGWTAPRLGTVDGGRSVASGLDLGLHWRSADQGMGRVRIGVWQHMGTWPEPVGMVTQTANSGNYNTRLEMQFSTANARGIQFELGGALGLQLNNNERVVLRISRGKPMVYYRLKF